MNSRFFWLPLSVLALLLGGSAIWLDSQIHHWLTAKYWGELQETHLLFRETLPSGGSEEALRRHVKTFNQAQENNEFLLFDAQGLLVQAEDSNPLEGLDSVEKQEIDKISEEIIKLV